MRLSKNLRTKWSFAGANTGYSPGGYSPVEPVSRSAPAYELNLEEKIQENKKISPYLASLYDN